MKRAKPKKQKKPIRDHKDVVEKSTHLLLSVCVRTLWTECTVGENKEL